MIQIMKDELFMAMRLMGTPTLKDIKESSVLTENLNTHIAMVPQDMLQRETYIPPMSQAVANHFERFDAAKAQDKAAKEAAKEVVADPTTAQVAVKLVSVVLTSVFKTVFTLDARASINRSAMFLMVFLVVHVAGNLSIFSGKQVFNEYTDLLVNGALSPAIKAIEIYLALAFVLHAAVGSYLTFKYKKLKPSKKESLAVYPLGQAKLALTGTAITVFVLVHLWQFRLDRPESVNGELPDEYSHVLSVMKDRKMAVLYCIGVLLLSAHLWSGWAKTTSKMDFSGADKALLKPAIAMGQMVVAAITVGYLAVIYKSHQIANE